MGDSLSELQAEYDREDQSTKREIGAYLYDRPAQWISKQKLAAEFDLDESGIAKHIGAFDDDGYVLLTTMDGKRYVQWDGRGAGGFRYWSKQIVPEQLWGAGNELRPFLTVDRLGGAYIPTILFGILVIFGVLMGTATFLMEYLDLDPILGWSSIDILVLTGITTMAASIFLVTAVAWRGIVVMANYIGEYWS
jgi:biotin operon repressor